LGNAILGFCLKIGLLIFNSCAEDVLPKTTSVSSHQYEKMLFILKSFKNPDQSSQGPVPRNALKATSCFLACLLH
jgi:hypothetical protein